MKQINVLLVLLLPLFASAQEQLKNNIFRKDSLVIIEANPKKGFNNAYMLFVPKGLNKEKLTCLLVEPNNTGKLSDNIEDHRKSAIAQAAVSSIGNNISTEIKVPLLVPVFPRLESKPLVYSHALDRDVMLEKEPDLKRLDLQLVAMIADAKERLKQMNIRVEDKIFMNGFSASATFTNRFLFLHPQLIKAAAMGGFNGELMLPLKIYKGQKIAYPLGLADFKRISGFGFNEKNYKTIPQFIYMGALDDNDAVKYDDAYNKKEQDLINTLLGGEVQSRYKNCQSIYEQESVNAKFKTYEKVGHWTTSAINLDVIRFFLAHLSKVKP
ncbi:hypothetical protein [Pedobacter sp.]|uniref:hypothetical protein n=1 Tax=Pedobacter sp. TaxID=1411316 RepID=UPI00396C98AD